MIPPAGISNTAKYIDPLPTFGAVVIVCLVIILSYANSLKNGFVIDDHYIIEMTHDRLGLRSAVTAFTSTDRLIDTHVSPYYRPLNRLSYLVDRALFGLNPVGYHAVNLFLHALCVLLLYFTLLHLGCGSIPSLLAALLFGVHPVNTEAVNFISARNNLLATLFVLGSFLVFGHAERTVKKAHYLFSGMLCFLGMLSKETAVMLIPLLLFLKLYGDRTWRNLRTILKWNTDFIFFHIVFFGLYLLLRLYAVDNHTSIDLMTGLSSRLSQLIYIIPAYGLLIIAPLRLSSEHVIPSDVSAALLPLAGAWIALLIAFCYLIRQRHERIVGGLAWLVFNFLPISNIVPLPSSTMAERYLYLPSIGIIIIVAHLLDRLTVGSLLRKLSLLVCAVSVVLFGFLTFTYNRAWRDDLSLASGIVKAYPAYASGHFELGYESYLRGDLITAEREFKRTLDLDPHHTIASWALYYLGAMKLEARDIAQGEQYFTGAANTDAGNAAAHYALASLLVRENTTAAQRHYALFLRTKQLHSSILLPEVTALLAELSDGRNPAAPAERADTLPVLAAPEKDAWSFLTRFGSGTSIFYRVASLNDDDRDIPVIVRYVLSKTDARQYRMWLIRYPLAAAVEAQFMLYLNCQQYLYKVRAFEFRDKQGAVLSQTYPEKEVFVKYEYLLPETPLRQLSEYVCRKGAS